MRSVFQLVINSYGGAGGFGMFKSHVERSDPQDLNQKE